MSKRDERAAKARSLILQGEQKSWVAKETGYRSVGGMMGAIVALEMREKNEREAQPLKIKREEERLNVLAEAWTKGVVMDVSRNKGLYVRLEGRHLLASYIGYRKSLNIEVKNGPVKKIRLYDNELGGDGALLCAVRELREMADKLLDVIEGQENEERKDQ